MKILTKRFTEAAAFATALTLFTGCESTISGVTPTATVSTVATPSTTDIKRIVSTGNSLTFNQATGGVNDMARNPVTGQPAIVYYDKSTNATGGVATGVLKYAYMDTTGSWNIEVVDANYGTVACGTALSYCIGAPNAATAATAVIMKLAFKSDGTPAIAYVYGGSLTTVGGSKQIRFAERINGGWSISVPFSTPTAAAATNGNVTATVDALKGVTLNFDSADRPHITFGFYAQTITSSKYKYASRSSAGSWTNADIMDIVTGAGTITGLTQGHMQNGAVMCPASGKLLLATSRVDTAAGIGKPIFVSCSTVDSTSGACTTWGTPLSLSNGCAGSTTCFTAQITTATNAATRMDIAIDAATQRPIIGMYTTTTPATSLVTTTAPNACDVAQPTTTLGWGAPQVVSAASAGSNGFRLGTSDSVTNVNVVAYLLGTTALHVNKATGPAGAWLATGTIAQTATVGAEGVGAFYDSSADQVFASFASIPAAAVGVIGSDIKVVSAQVGDVTNGGAAGSFLISVVDQAGTTFPAMASAVPALSAAKAPNGSIGYAYFFNDTTAVDAKLYYGTKGGVASAPVFHESLVVNFVEGTTTPQFVGSYPSLAYDANSNPIIAFYNGVTADQSLNVARSFNGGMTFSVSTVDEIAANVGQYPSVATSGNAVGISYYDVTNDGLKFARWTTTHGWRRYAVDGMTGAACGIAGDNAGKYSHLRFTSTGRPVIVYQSNSALKMAVGAEALTSATYTWTCVGLDSGTTRGEGIDVVLSSTDVPHIAHFDATAGTVRYVTCDAGVLSCAATGSGAFTGSVVGNSGITTSVVTMPTIAINDSGTVYIAHYSDSNQGGMALLSKTSSASSFTTEYIDQNSGGGSYTSAAGQYATMVINSSGFPSIFYQSAENWIRFFSREYL